MNSYVINIDELFKRTKDMKVTIDRIIEFFEKTKIFIRTPKINKRDLSPIRIIKAGSDKRRKKTVQKTNKVINKIITQQLFYTNKRWKKYISTNLKYNQEEQEGLSKFKNQTLTTVKHPIT